MKPLYSGHEHMEPTSLQWTYYHHHFQTYTYLVILIGSDCGELRAGENESLEILPVQVVDVVGLHHMEAWLVLVHAVDNNLQQRATIAAMSTAKYQNSIPIELTGMHARKCAWLTQDIALLSGTTITFQDPKDPGYALSSF